MAVMVMMTMTMVGWCHENHHVHSSEFLIIVFSSMSSQEEFDAELQKRSLVESAKDAELLRMGGLLGEAPKQAEKLMTLTTEQVKFVS